MNLLDILIESIEEQQEIDEAGMKDAVLGALMSLPFLNPSQATELRKNISIDPKDTATIASAIKDTSNKKELGAVLKDIKDDPSSGSPVKRESVPAPSGYKKLTLQQRQDWNKYLEFLRQEGLQGSPKLDSGEPTLGKKILFKYLKDNPESSLNDFGNQDNLIRSIQYEMKLLRKGVNGEPFGLTSDELKGYQELLWKIRNKFMTTRTSDSDGNPGQYTTMEYYPSFSGDVDYPKYTKYFTK